MSSGPQFFRDKEDAEREEREISSKAALGIAYQRAIAELRPVEVYNRINSIHEHIMAVGPHVLGRDAVMSLESVEHEFRDFYSGRDRKKS